MSAAFLLALVLHASGGVVVGYIVARSGSWAVPSFQKGESGLSLTVLPSVEPVEAPDPVAPEPAAPDMTPPAVVPSEPVPDVPPSPSKDAEIPVAPPEELRPAEPVQRSAQDADLAVKGIKADLVVGSEIRPAYPLGSRMRGEEGTVTVRVLVDSGGHALTAVVTQSTGFPALDEAAVKAVLKARFTASDGSRPREGETDLSIRFQLVE